MNRHRRRTEIPTITLPHDLIVQILLRLPVRSLIRFKSVCKSWLSLVSDPQFGESHFDLAASPTHRCLTEGYACDIKSIDVDAPSLHNDSAVVNLEYPRASPRLPWNPVEFLGSCRGFILVAYQCGEAFLWNPSTGVHKKFEVIEELYYNVHGFGYDSSRDDYLVVHLELIDLEHYLKDDQRAIVDHPTRISIFSSKKNAWSCPEVASDVQYVELDSDRVECLAGCLLNEALHWLVISYETKLHVIIVFDLVERSLSEISLPQVLAGELEHKEYCLRVMRECLCLCYPGSMTSMAEIWMMKTYEVQSSWTKLFAFSTCNIPYNVFYPICFTKHGRIFGSNGYGRLMILDDKGWLHDLSAARPEPDKYEYIPIHCGAFRRELMHCGMYRESLLSLPNDFEEEGVDSEEAREDEQLTSFFEEGSDDDQLLSSLLKSSEDDK
ncbi:F-box protein CPR1-like [Lotus japonicus]|uniref:F-box protein CPR1-like n=1 Tax=Lotus japonicus TaxID=34305 RepID=UPI00258654F1|nr:F-box protein CPR1-like [Lotus japonicus]XP_057447290.1 F-box protein CPR1-like [Lotus japonicus]XP_057447291.1 F-box protein CPR1-like [Lotus japonicus]XP_057447292.1 F-box protein CPR1-like [Lotus japonicus]